jgi:mitochondrial inner membrane protease subunit 1
MLHRRIAAIALSGLALLLVPMVALAWLFRRFEVTGESMRPTLVPSDKLLIARIRAARRGDLLVIRDPRDPGRSLVKRVWAARSGCYEVRGDNDEASTDSRAFGGVPLDLVRGRVVYRYSPRERRGWLF